VAKGNDLQNLQMKPMLGPLLSQKFLLQDLTSVLALLLVLRSILMLIRSMWKRLMWVKHSPEPLLVDSSSIYLLKKCRFLFAAITDHNIGMCIFIYSLNKSSASLVVHIYVSLAAKEGVRSLQPEASNHAGYKITSNGSCCFQQ
jgi:hypothetical protein